MGIYRLLLLPIYFLFLGNASYVDEPRSVIEPKFTSAIIEVIKFVESEINPTNEIQRKCLDPHAEGEPEHCRVEGVEIKHCTSLVKGKYCFNGTIIEGNQKSANKMMMDFLCTNLSLADMGIPEGGRFNFGSCAPNEFETGIGVENKIGCNCDRTTGGWTCFNIQKLE